MKAMEFEKYILPETIAVNRYPEWLAAHEGPTSAPVPGGG